MRISISYKLTAILIIASAAPLAIAVTLAYHYAASEHKQYAGRQEREWARDAADSIDASVRVLIAQIRLFATMPAVTTYLQQRDREREARHDTIVDWASLGEDEEPLRSVLNNPISREARGLVANNAAFLSLFFVGRSGMLLAATERPGHEEWWSARALGASEPVVGIEEGKLPGDTILSIATGIECPATGFMGAVGAKVDAREVFAAARKGIRASGAHFDVVRGAQVVWATRPERVGRVLDGRTISMLKEPPRWVVAESRDGQKELLGMAEVEVSGEPGELYVVAREDAGKALARMRSHLALIVALGGCSIVVFFLVGLYFSHRQIAAPVKRLIRGARELAAGDLSHRIEPHHSRAPAVGPVPGDDELDDLANEFNRMADAILESRASLEQKVEQRTRELAEENRRALEARAQLEEAVVKLREAQANLIQTEKLASIGLLAAGIAHEINNPLSFILNNVSVIERDYNLILDILLRYRKLRLGGNFDANGLQRIEEKEEHVDVEYLEASADRIFSSTLHGLNRVKTIVLDLKDFARLDEQEAELIDLEGALDATLDLARYYLVTGGVEVIRDYAGVPMVQCLPGRLNQVFLNFIMNAVQAMEGGGTITLRTAVQDDHVLVKIIDTGCGIPPEHLSRIFDPFFTTKRPGEAAGLGLSVSYGIIREHNGTIEVASEPGKGSSFTISLPLGGAESSP